MPLQGIFMKQPFRFFYLLYVFISTITYQVPKALLLSLPPFRPIKSWPYLKAFRLLVLQHLMTTFGPSVGPPRKAPNYLAIPTDLKPNMKGVWIEPVDSSLIQGRLAEFAARTNTKAERIPGYWYWRKAESNALVTPATANEKLILNLHGGGYIGQSAHPSDPTQTITRGVLEHVKSIDRILSVEYRLSAGPPYKPAAGAFPAALLDALSAYSYVISSLGFKPSNVVVMGDSAGANLALALARYLVSVGIPTLPPPGGLILHSPWADIGNSHEGPTSSLQKFSDTDYLTNLRVKNTYGYPVRSFTGTLGVEVSETEPWISPASKNLPSDALKDLFKGFPPTIILGGGVEQLLDSIKTLRDRMTTDLGSKLEYVELEDAFHDPIVFSWAEPERTKALEAVARWHSKVYP